MRRAALAAVFFFTLAACDPGYDIAGTVTACADGTPINRAVVLHLWPGQNAEDVAYTDQDGAFYISAIGILEKVVTVRVLKPTWRTATTTVPNEDWSPRVNLCLEPAP